MNKLEKIGCDFEIIAIDNLKGFAINNKEKKQKITIYDENLITDVIAKNFNKKYRELLYIVMDIYESEDATATDAELVLLKITDLREKILKMKFITPEQLNRYLKMLLLLEEKVKIPEHNRGR